MKSPKPSTATLLRQLAELKAMVDPHLHISEIQTTTTFIGRDGSGENVRLTTRDRTTRSHSDFDQISEITLHFLMVAIEALETELNLLKTNQHGQKEN